MSALLEVDDLEAAVSRTAMVGEGLNRNLLGTGRLR